MLFCDHWFPRQSSFDDCRIKMTLKPVVANKQTSFQTVKLSHLSAVSIFQGPMYKTSSK